MPQKRLTRRSGLFRGIFRGERVYALETKRLVADLIGIKHRTRHVH